MARPRLRLVIMQTITDFVACPACGATSTIWYNVMLRNGVEVRRWPPHKRRCPNHCTHDQIKVAEEAAQGGTIAYEPDE